jgi:hypothetical protein
MITKKHLLVLIALATLPDILPAQGFFNKAARGLYQTTKYSLIGAPAFFYAGNVAYFTYHSESIKNDAENNLFSTDKHSFTALKEIFPDAHTTIDRIHNYIKKEAAQILNAPEENILVKANLEMSDTSHVPYEKDGTLYHIIHLGFADPIADLATDLKEYVVDNKPTAAPFFIKHEIAHGKFDHGKKKGDLLLGFLVGGYIASCLLLKKGSLLGTIAIKTASAITFPALVYKGYNYTSNKLSQKYEWQADNFAISQINDPEILKAAALKFDQHYETIQKNGLNDPSHPCSKERADNLRAMAQKLHDREKLKVMQAAPRGVK